MNPKDLVGAKKAPMDLVPPAGAIMSAPAHKNGADKYGPFNWRLQPVQAMTYVAAVRRHLDAWVDGQDNAPDTGIHHFSHALAGMNILADAYGLGNLIDNRPPKGPAADMLAAQDHSIAISELKAEAQKAVRDGCTCPGPDACGGFRCSPAAMVPAELAICEDSGNHTPGRHLMTCPDFS